MKAANAPKPGKGAGKGKDAAPAEEAPLVTST